MSDWDTGRGFGFGCVPQARIVSGGTAGSRTGTDLAEPFTPGEMGSLWFRKRLQVTKLIFLCQWIFRKNIPGLEYCYFT